MARREARGSARGLLLVEAILSAVAIAVGLVIISRGLASPLRALRAIEGYDALLAQAHSTLIQLETAHIFGVATAAMRSGTLDASSAYAWAVAGSPREGPQDLKATDGRALTSDVTLTVDQGAASPLSVSVQAVWPSDWVQ